MKRAIGFALAFALAFAIGATCGCGRIVYPGDGRPVSLVLVGEGWTIPATLVELQSAIDMWRPAGANFQIGGDSAYRLTVHDDGTMPCGTDVAGCYEYATGEIWIIAGTGAGGFMQTAAHELGHAIGLEHVPVGIMQAGYEQFDGLQPDDVAEYRRIWN